MVTTLTSRQDMRPPTDGVQFSRVRRKNQYWDYFEDQVG